MNPFKAAQAKQAEWNAQRDARNAMNGNGFQGGAWNHGGNHGGNGFGGNNGGGFGGGQNGGGCQGFQQPRPQFRQARVELVRVFPNDMVDLRAKNRPQNGVNW